MLDFFDTIVSFFERIFHLISNIFSSIITVFSFIQIGEDFILVILECLPIFFISTTVVVLFVYLIKFILGR